MEIGNNLSVSPAASTPVTQASFREQLQSATPDDAKTLVDKLTTAQLKELTADVQQLSASDRDNLINHLAGNLDARHLLKIEPAFGRESMANAVDSFGTPLTRLGYQRHTSEGTMTRDGNHLTLETGNQNDVVEVNVDSRNGDFLFRVNGTQYRFGSAEIQKLTIKTHGGDDTVTVQPGVKFGFHIETGKGNDIITAGDGDDVIDAGDGNDYIDGRGGNDRIKGGAGDDVIYAGEGNDIVDGGSGNDYIDGYGGNDVIDGGEGDDVISGGRDRDTIKGGAGNDIIYTGTGEDTVEDTEGTNTIYYQAEDKLTVNDATRNNSKSAIVEPVKVPNNLVINGSAAFQERVRADLETLAASPTGRQMMDAINQHASLLGIFGGKTVNINPKPANLPPGPGVYMKFENGGNSTVSYDPAWRLQDYGPVPPIIGFYHELAHANTHQNNRTAVGNFQDTARPDHPDTGVDNSERQAVGLPFDHDNNAATPMRADPNHPQALTENSLRTEMGYPLREAYTVK